MWLTALVQPTTTATKQLSQIESPVTGKNAEKFRKQEKRKKKKKDEEDDSYEPLPDRPQSIISSADEKGNLFFFFFVPSLSHISSTYQTLVLRNKKLLL